MRLKSLANIIIRECYKTKNKTKIMRTNLEVLLYQHDLKKTIVSEHLGWSRPRLDRWLRNPVNQTQENINAIKKINDEIRKLGSNSEI